MADVVIAEHQLAAADREQVAMMEERVIVTDYYDVPIGSGSKKDTHIWSNISGGMLHRAFSVFLFTPDGKLVLQQRAGTKITFPHIWANTCCSHPLDVASEREVVDARGVKNAARRKLEHELGIPPEDVPLDSFTWLTRVHYVGSSRAGVAEGAEPVWGEHEIDWILMCTPPALPRMALNDNEVAQTRAFSQAELREWMATRHVHGNNVSPWFGVMEASGLLYRWWDAVLAGRLDTVIDRPTIHRQHDLEALAAGTAPGSVPMPPAFKACLDETNAAVERRAAAGAGVAPSVAAGGAAASGGPKVLSGGAVAAVTTPATPAAAGGAGADGAAIPGATAVVSKQGAYGKVRIHSEGKLSQLSHLDEVWEMVLFKLGRSPATQVPPLPADASPARRFCETMLTKVSRSFALVIQQLPDHLRLSICVFYLVLRGLDTVEDDMVAFAGRQVEKLHHLRNFHLYLRDPGFGIEGVGEGDEAALLRDFKHCNAAFATLLPVEQDVIADICARMGEGMAAFAGRDLREGTADTSDYNLYCHYVAGLVGEGLSRLFVAHGDEDSVVARDIALANDMGLFLQKTNIIRDYLEDLVEGRAFWPRTIWSQYAPALGNLRSKVDALLARGAGTPPSADALQQEDVARACLNHMVADALTLAPSCLRYMERLRTPGVFRFCSIPQLMAIATLEKLANNADVYTGVVKLRKGLALKLLARAVSMDEIHATFLRSARAILRAIPPHHKAAHELARRATEEVEAIALARLPPSYGVTSPLFSPTAVVTVLVVFLALLRHLYFRSRNGTAAGGWTDSGYMPRITNSWDVAAVAAAVACAAYILAVGAVPLVLSLTSGGTGAGAGASPRSGSPVPGKSAPAAGGEGSAAAGSSGVWRRLVAA